MLSRLPMAIVITTLFAACTEDPNQDPPAYPISDKRERNRTCAAQPPPPPSGRVRWRRVFDKAGFDLSNQFIVEAKQSPENPDVWYVVQQFGKVYEVTEGKEAKVLADLESLLDTRGPELGLVSVAAHPEFSKNGYFYAVYSAPTPGKDSFVSRLARFEMDGDTLNVDSELVLIDQEQRNNVHNGNQIEFGPDGYLYYLMGDDIGFEKSAPDPNNLKGSVLRIDVNGTDGDKNYAIPDDNPFVGGGGLPEIYAYGLRNPWRMSFHPDSGELYVADVGQDRREEINIVKKGENYGWPGREGTLCYREKLCDDPDLVDPWIEYSHAEGKSVSGGHAYAGDAIPELRGRFLYADYITGHLWSAPVGEESPPTNMEIEGSFNIASMAQGADGELYMVRYDFEGESGGVYKLVANDPKPSEFPKKLSETGCVNTEAPFDPVDGVIAFSPIAQLWSDGAQKTRYFALPDDQRLQVENDGDLSFPKGSVLIKHFYFDEQLHETRLLMHTSDGWNGYSYEWNDEQTDATLLESEKVKDLENGVRWYYPGRSACMECHTGSAGRTLGPEITQMDWEFDTSGADENPENQIDWLFEHDYFVPDVLDVSEVRSDHESLVDPFGDADQDARARSYLHSNCSGCHRPGGVARGEVDLRFSRSFAETNTCNLDGEAGKLWHVGVPGSQQKVIVPGEPEKSILWLRMSLLGIFRMPSLGSEVVHDDALTLIGDWITDMEDCPSD